MWFALSNAQLCPATDLLMCCPRPRSILSAFKAHGSSQASPALSGSPF